MSQQDSKSASILPNGCGCLLFLMGIGVIGAIAVQSFLNSPPTGCRPPEAKFYVSSINKGQQAYFAEKKAFSSSVNALGLGLKKETTNYKYFVRATKQTAFVYGIPKKPQLKSYVGGVFVIRAKSNNGEDEMRTESILCSTDTPGTIPHLPPQLQNSKLVCPTGTTQVTT